MARTQRGKRLTEEHRLAQVGLAEALAKFIRAVFGKTFDYYDIDDSSEVFVRRVAPDVARMRERSRELSLDYLREFQAVEAPDAPPPIEEPGEYEPADAARELLKTTRGVGKSVSHKGYSVEEAQAAIEQAVIGKATKIVEDGGRQVIEQEVRRGHGPVGYARVVDADPCPFCAMLASRGIYYMGEEIPGVQLYRSDAFTASNARFVGDGRFKVHDHCCCTLEPVYMVDGKVDLPGNGNQLAFEWAEIASGQPDPWKSWQRWRQSGTLPEDYDGPLEGKRRRRPPVRGQSTGQRARPTPAKASERKGGTDADSGWDKARYLEAADGYEKRLQGVRAEIAELKERGQTSDDLPVMALEHEAKKLVSRIDAYREYADKL